MPRRFAITIGVNRYEFLPKNGLSYAERDALQIRDLLQNKLGFEKVLLFAQPENGSGRDQERPFRANLRKALNNFAQKIRLTEADSIWFFFSGHGAREAGCDYLLPSDGDPDDVQETAISTDFVMRRLRQCGAGQVVMLLDACRNVVSVDGQRSGSKNVGGVGQQTQDLAKQQGIISLFSCAPEQISWELDALQQGAFTQALLEKLGDRQNGATLTVQGLDQFLRQRVPELNRLYSKPTQDPYVIAEPSWRYLQPILPGASVPAMPEPAPEPDNLPTLDIRDLKAQASDALHDGELDRAKALYQQIVEEAEDAGDRRRAMKAIENIILQQAQTSLTSMASATATPKAVTPSSQRTETPFRDASVPQHPPQVPPPPSPQPKSITLQLQPQKKGWFGGQPDPVPLELLPIPGGTFWMGQTEAETQQLKKEAGEDTYQKFFARELPRHRVTVPPFWMGRYPVTQAQYEAVMGNNPTQGTAYAWTGSEWNLEPISSKFLGNDKPVIGVTWDEAVEFCQKLTQDLPSNLRQGRILLPTEAQWEYACRAGTETAFYFGDRLEPDQANFNGNYTYNGSKRGEYREVTTSVGSFPANAWGLQDMHGNVWEWCQDHFYDSYQRKPQACKDNGSIAWTRELSGISPFGNESYRLLRGGSWYNNPGDCRSASRLYNTPTNRYFDVGFRVMWFSA